MLLSIKLNPEIKFVWLFLFSTIIPDLVLYLACALAPKIESNIDDKNPHIITKKIISLLAYEVRYVNIPNMIAPIKDPSVPTIVIPPEIPWSTDLKFNIEIGLTLDNLPNSVPHVSDIAADIEAKNNGNEYELGYKNPKIQIISGIPPFA